MTDQRSETTGAQRVQAASAGQAAPAVSCCQHYEIAEHGESVFNVEAPPISFGRGALDEVGPQAEALGCRRVALFTDPRVGKLEHVARVAASLRQAGVDFALYDAVAVEPTDRSWQEATRFASQGSFDGFVSVGGGSVIDTCKAANLYSTHPADFFDYVNRPIGLARPIPGPLAPHIACPTTCGTGSECTGIAIFSLAELKTKTGIASRRLRPTVALVDPDCTETLPNSVVAASGFDQLSHALESLTARPFTSRPRPANPLLRPISQGANPWSDFGSLEALRLCGEFLVRAVRDPTDREARERMMFAATLAGIAFGNAGVHIPHAMAYGVAGNVRDFRMPGYPPDQAMVPHGIAVIVNAPAVFRATAATNPARHLAAASALGVDTSRAAPQEAGEILARAVIEMMQKAGVPNGISGVGYGAADVAALTSGTIVQQRLLDNAPIPADRETLDELFRQAVSYW